MNAFSRDQPPSNLPFTDTTGISDAAWLELKARLDRSKFRARFKLGKLEAEYIQTRKRETIRKHTLDFISLRIAPAAPLNDGKQTPMKGHPVFVAQHATGTCCRSCLKKWHGIPEGIELTAEQIQYVASVVMRWLAGQQTQPASQDQLLLPTYQSQPAGY